MMKYFIWQNSNNPGEALLYGAWPDSLADVSMITGNPIGRDLPIVNIRMNARSQGQLTDSVLMTGHGRIFSRRLVNLLGDCGIKNLETFPCTIHNEVTGEKHDDFLAVNIVGKLACINHAASACDFIDEDETKLLAWDYLTFDESQIHDLPIFVLAEMPVQIVVHQRIMQAMQAAQITGVDFVEQGDHSFNPSANDL
jgi:hypothetical protein